MGGVHAGAGVAGLAEVGGLRPRDPRGFPGPPVDHGGPRVLDGQVSGCEPVSPPETAGCRGQALCLF